MGVTLVSAISLLQSGQISVVGTPEYARLTVMTLPFARQMSGRAKKAHPGLGACQSEKLELELARSLCASGSITDIVRLLSTRVEKNAITVARWATMPQPVRGHRRVCRELTAGKQDLEEPSHPPCVSNV